MLICGEESKLDDWLVWVAIIELVASVKVSVVFVEELKVIMEFSVMSGCELSVKGGCCVLLSVNELVDGCGPIVMIM
jgi:hypothetical protein